MYQIKKGIKHQISLTPKAQISQIEIINIYRIKQSVNNLS